MFQRLGNVSDGVIRTIVSLQSNYKNEILVIAIMKVHMTYRILRYDGKAIPQIR